MNVFKIIQHPLDRFSFSGNLGDLTREGRTSLEQLMTMIDDMRFRTDSVWGTCARYFLLIDLSWFPQLCFSSQIQWEKLRDHLWLYERGELENVFGHVHAVLPFSRKNRQSMGTFNSEFERQFEIPSAREARSDDLNVSCGKLIQRSPLIGIPSESAAAPVQASDKRRKRLGPQRA